MFSEKSKKSDCKICNQLENIHKNELKKNDVNMHLEI